MKFTNFFKLKNAVRQIGISQFEVELSQKLKLGSLEGDTSNDKNLVLSEYGIYYLEQGVLAKIILHITDTDLLWLEKKPLSLEAFNNNNYSSPHFVDAIHKYHFTKCRTLKKMFSEGKKTRYYQSQKIDGNFHYSILNKNNIIYKSPEQKLYVCSHCLKSLKNLNEKNYTAKNFIVTDIFQDTSLQGNNYELSCNAIPNIYHQDWHIISQKAKEQVGYKCESCDINLIKNKKYLHCHHIDSCRNNNYASNLQILCVKCHANQSGHEHIKKLSAYKEFINYEG